MEIVSSKSQQFLQIDILKGLMIMLVIIDHAIPTNVRAEWGHSLWERISIPMFLIIMGFNAASSFAAKGLPFDTFTAFLSYVRGKFKRYLIPFAILYLVSTGVGLIIYGDFESLLMNQFDSHWSRNFLYNFILPFYGPGNWFIPVIMQSVFIVPLVYLAYRKYPRMTLFLSFIWEILIQLFIYFVIGHPWTWSSWRVIFDRLLVQCSILAYLNAIVLGFWISDHNNISPRVKKLPGHFYLVLMVVIVSYILAIKPLLGNFLKTEFTIIILLFLILTVVGIYTYRPLKFFLIIWFFSAALGFLFIFLLNSYLRGVSWTIYEDRTLTEINGRLDIFLLICATLIIPTTINFKVTLKNHIWWIFPAFLMSGIYLAYYQWAEFRFFMVAGDYHFLVYPFSAFILLLFLKMLPKKSNKRILNKFSIVGKASYHILLTQMFVYGIWLAKYGNFYLKDEKLITHLGGLFDGIDYITAVWLYVILMWAICLPIGIGWYVLEKQIQLVKGRHKIKIIREETETPENKCSPN